LWVFVSSGRGLCDRPIPRPEESYRLWCVWVWSSENKQPRHLLWVGRRGKGYVFYIWLPLDIYIYVCVCVCVCLCVYVCVLLLILQ
jgi:hypothetical protein